MYHISPCELLVLPIYIEVLHYTYVKGYFPLLIWVSNYSQSSNIKIHNLQSSNLKSIIYSAVRYPDCYPIISTVFSFKLEDPFLTTIPSSHPSKEM